MDTTPKDTRKVKKPKMEDESKYLPELLAEKDSLDASFTHAMKLLNEEIERIQKGEPKKEAETYLDLFSTKNVRVKERVLIPIKQYPRFNFVGKILGPQGNTIKRLQEETGAKISVLGRGSMRDKNKEEELRKGGEPKYAHLAMELHVFIEVYAPIPEAYLRMAHAMEEVKKFLVPVDNVEDIHQEQFMEMGYLNGNQDQGGRGRGGPPGRGRGAPPPQMSVPRGRGMLQRGAGPRGGAQRGGPGRGGAVRGAPSGRGGPPPSAPPGRGGAATRARPSAPPPQRMLPSSALSHQHQHQQQQPQHQHQHPAAPESYEEYPYEETYPEGAYEGYEYSHYSQPPQAETEYYDYGHGEAQETYESYAEDDWEGGWAAGGGGKPAAGRQNKNAPRAHPYSRPF
ncbi:KH domain-containing, RNA-binding, signal transduction-associated protein 1a [Clupea harengus]|uniref:KH domain-containing, RNA-binding, signal transduction-associated protein 1 n=1 Tax=Clupea harengus TaxID=7950 RepID=A0A6P3W534_CLUHA|nr:KH domain-containing, RNA-binding, signal transduction-associated protein 1a [Clupea harengus]